MKGRNGLNLKDRMVLLIEIILLIGFLAFFFYHSVWGVFPFVPIGILYAKQKESNLFQKKKEVLRSQFKDALVGISANLRAGYAVENAFRECLHEMNQLYGKQSPIYQAMYVIVQRMTNNIALEQLLKDFANEADIEEIKEFADVFGIAKKMGGNMPEIMGETASAISEKIEVNREIQVILSAKQLEQNVMNVIPFGIVLYIMFVSKGYFDVLYHSAFGVGVMTVCMLVYFIAYFWGKKIVDIQI